MRIYKSGRRCTHSSLETLKLVENPGRTWEYHKVTKTTEPQKTKSLRSASNRTGTVTPDGPLQETLPSNNVIGNRNLSRDRKRSGSSTGANRSAVSQSQQRMEVPGVEIGELGPSAQSGQPAAALPNPAAPARAAAQPPTQSTNSTTSIARSRSSTGASTSSWETNPVQVEKFPELPSHTTSSGHQQHPLHHPHHLHHHHQPASEAVSYTAEGTPTSPAATAPTPVLRLNTDHTELASPGPPPSASCPAIGRPPSLSIQSTASSSDYSSSLSDGDLVFDSRRSSVVTSVSTASAYNPLSSPCCQSDSSPEQPLTRTRRDAKQLHAARLERSGSTSLALASTKREALSPGPRNPTRFQRASSEPTRAPKLVTEQPAGFTKMAFAEQQQWITVQQKTFTKWLNTKIEVRGLEVKDLVKDLSDAVRYASPLRHYA